MNRKLFALALVVLLPLGLLAGSGDVNGDGRINVADIVELVNYLKGNSSEKFNIDEADVNNDGTIDNDDVEALSDKVIKGEVVADHVYLGCENGTIVVVAPPSGGVIEIHIIGSKELKVKV